MSATSVLPTRLRLADLLHTTDRFADDVLRGRYDHLFPAAGLPRDERWFVRLHGDDELDVWLISWVPQRSTELHDHRWDGEGLRERSLVAGDQAGFPLGWVHDVEDDAEGRTTLSVHAYSPPLTVMSYYDLTDRDTLRRTRTTLTDAPEDS